MMELFLSIKYIYTKKSHFIFKLFLKGKVEMKV